MAERTPSPRVLLHHQVFATPDLTASGGFRSLSPPSGFADAASGPHFFKVRCLYCGDETTRDVAVYALPAGARTCKEKFGARMLTKKCYPKCPSVAHLVRKCANYDCRELGSLEVQEVTASLNQTDRIHFLNVDTLGCEVVNYSAGQEWESISATGEAIPVLYGADVFRGTDAAGGNIAIPTAFDVVQME